jgi:putative DNA primase/helicase
VTNDPKVVDFPVAEERARRVRDLVETRARMPEVEWLFYLPADANTLGLEEPALKQMIEAQIKANEKQKREEQGELREQERKREREEDKAERRREREVDKAERREREREREEERAERRERAEERRARAEGERRGRALEAIVALPTAEHEPELKKLAERRGESLDSLRITFNLLLAVEREKIARGEITPWAKPVDTRALLGELTAQIERYVVIHQREAATAIVLWTCFAWCHDIATFSPILVIQSGDIEGGKTTASKVISLLTPRARVIAEPTGPSLYRYVDRHHPTLIVDDADRLLAHRPDLAHIVNVSLTRGALIHRTDVKGRTLAFDPFCPKVLNGINLLAHLQPGTRSRCITVGLLPKLAHEKVVSLRHTVEDETFVTLQRKLLRWASDNMSALKKATPAMPEGFANRLEENFVLLFAIADLAGGDWPKKARAAARRLAGEHNEPSTGKRLLAAFRDLFAKHGKVLASDRVAELLAADEEGEWANYRGHRINKWEIAQLLRPYNIRPELIWQRGKPVRGYKAERFATAFRHFLPAEGR